MNGNDTKKEMFYMILEDYCNVLAPYIFDEAYIWIKKHMSFVPKNTDYSTVQNRFTAYLERYKGLMQQFKERKTTNVQYPFYVTTLGPSGELICDFEIECKVSQKELAILRTIPEGKGLFKECKTLEKLYAKIEKIAFEKSIEILLHKVSNVTDISLDEYQVVIDV